MVNFNSSPQDKKLFEAVVNESISTFGIDIDYLTTTFDTAKDSLYSEDTKPLIGKKTSLTAYTETIDEEWILSRFGFQSDDSLVIHIGKKDFLTKVGEVPKEGDYVIIKYMNNRLFIVTDADEEGNIFHQEKFVWNLHLKAADISGEEVLAGIGVTDYESIEDVQNDNDAITEAASGIVVEKAGDTDPFGDWL